LQSAVGPLGVITGLEGVVFTVTVCVEVAVQPAAFVTVTV
jgi:hypothetical protein